MANPWFETIAEAQRRAKKRLPPSVSSALLAGSEKGLTLVPTRMYFKDGRVKVEIALARGRERADKRRVVAERDAQRDIERALKRRR